MVKKILDAMMHGVANTEEKARILQSGLERFGIEYKSILNDLMDNKKLFVDIGTVWVRIFLSQNDADTQVKLLCPRKICVDNI